jgi:N-methylhydantoinase B
MTRAEISAIPDGTYEFSDKLDDNALDPESGPVTIAVKMTVHGDELEFDFAGSDPQVPSAINNVLTSTASVVYYGVRTLTGDRIPNNDGCFRPVKVTAPEGCVVNASYPAPVASRGIALMRIEDVVVGVLGKALPDKMTAAHSGQYTMVSVAGFHPETGDSMIGQLSGPVVGGHGARPGKDGIDVSSHGCTNGTIDAMELGESRYPMRFNRLELWPDSGGAGRYRGGLGWFAEVEWTQGDSTITFRRERTRFQPWGIAGGKSAPLCRTEFVSEQGEAKPLPAKIVLPFKVGEKLRYWTTGSGGYGSPLERDPASVLEDVLNGRVSGESAQADYGVIIDDEAVNVEATRALRQKMATHTQ